MTTLVGDRERTIVAMATARSWHDAEYRERLIAQPKAVLAEEGLEFPEGMTLKIVEDAGTARYWDDAESVRYISLGSGTKHDLVTAKTTENDPPPPVLILLLTS